MSDVKAVLDGRKIKWTLEQAQAACADKVRVDWLRFTLPIDSVIPSEIPNLDWLGPHVELAERDPFAARVLLPQKMALGILTADGAFCYLTPKSVAWQGLVELSVVLPGLFPLTEAEDSGMDFYAARVPIVINDAVCGYVLAGGKSPAQSGTVHFNLFGSAALHLTPERLAALADFIQQKGGWITRVDLAFDVFDGLEVTRVQKAWADGKFDVRGKRPSQREMGSWSSGHSRTFEIGSRTSGKLLRAYEKGDQLLGHEADDPWVRLEVEFRNNQRVLEPAILRRPGDFFAGAYPWLADFMDECGAGFFLAQRIPTHNQVVDKVADVAVERLIRWVGNTAGPSLRALWELGGDLIAEVVDRQQHRKVRRLRGFDSASLQKAFDRFAREIPKMKETGQALPFSPSNLRAV